MDTLSPAMRIWEGTSSQLGATWDGLGVNFALFSANATKVELCLFDPAGTHETQRIELPEYTDEVWHGYLPAPVAVGMSVTRHPPHRSPRAELPHEAPILDEWRQSEPRGRDEGRAGWEATALPVG
jgi:pullulanase/glycogen debranching enzyme